MKSVKKKLDEQEKVMITKSASKLNKTFSPILIEAEKSHQHCTVTPTACNVTKFYLNTPKVNTPGVDILNMYDTFIIGNSFANLNTTGDATHIPTASKTHGKAKSFHKINLKKIQLTENIKKTLRHFKCSENQIRLKQKVEQDYYPMDETIPVLTSTPAVNKFLIRDFQIGECNANFKQSSRKHLKIACDYFELKNQKFKQQCEKFDQLFKQEDIALPNLCLSTKKEQTGKKENLKKTKSSNFADLILKINCMEYRNVDDPKDSIINRGNLDRLLQLHKIIKRKEDNRNELNEMMALKLEEDNGFILRKTRVGIPNFVKNKFKSSTLEKFRAVKGKYFGVYC